MAIFMTGDTHGDFSRLRPVPFREQGGLTKDRYFYDLHPRVFW